jgi:hypothetical protein
MSDFCFSNDDREEFLTIVRAINPLTVSAYGPMLASWGLLARISPNLASRKALADVLKTINPPLATAYGPLLDAWAARPANRLDLARILRLVNPVAVSAYGELLDAWANKLEAVRAHGRLYAERRR